MKILKPKKIILLIKKYPFKDTFFALKYLPRVFNRPEKFALLLFSILIILFISIIGYNRWLKSTILVPEAGGIFREGIIGESKDLDKHIARLINAGLTKYDGQKNIVSDLAKSWEITENGKVYVFHLNEQYNSEDLVSRIVSKGMWSDIEIATPDLSTISFTFKQPFSPFLYTSTEPIFEYGPYRITKESRGEVELSFRDDYLGGRPLIDKIIIKFYQNQNDLIKAAKRGDIDGFALTNDVDLNESFTKYETKLPRTLTIFFNLSNKNLQDINVRRAFKENTASPKEIEIRLVTSDSEKNVNFAKEIADKWGKNGIKVNLDIKDNVTLQKTTIPKRDYDILLYGLDYGEDPDPYPFWHSSQIKEDGKNLSNFKNQKADKLLEEARQEFDFQKRSEKYAEFQKILDQEMPFFVVENEILYYQVNKKVNGIEKIVGAFEADRFMNVAKWYIQTKRVKK